MPGRIIFRTVGACVVFTYIVSLLYFYASGNEMALGRLSLPWSVAATIIVSISIHSPLDRLIDYFREMILFGGMLNVAIAAGVAIWIDRGFEKRSDSARNRVLSATDLKNGSD